MDQRQVRAVSGQSLTHSAQTKKITESFALVHDHDLRQEQNLRHQNPTLYLVDKSEFKAGLIDAWETMSPAERAASMSVTQETFPR